MGLGRYEQETTILYNNDEPTMRIYTADPSLMRRLSSLSAYKLIREHRQGGQVVAMDFEADKKLLTLRKERQKGRPMTEEQKAALQAGAKKYREGNSLSE